MSEQLTFDLPTRPALERGDFFIANSNALALKKSPRSNAGRVGAWRFFHRKQQRIGLGHDRRLRKLAPK